MKKPVAKRSFVLFLGLLSFINTSFAINQKNIKPKISYELESIACNIDGQQCTTVGYKATYEKGHLSAVEPLIYNSSDGGKQWHLSQPLSKSSDKYRILRHVSCDDSGLQCVAVGDSHDDFNKIKTPLSYTTADGGKNWVLSTITTETPHGFIELNQVICDRAAKECIAFGSSSEDNIPVRYTSSDGGKNWFSLQTEGIIPGHVACDDQLTRCTSIGYKEEPIGYVSNDGGKSWEQSSVLPKLSWKTKLTSIHCDSTGMLCTTIGTYQGYIVKLFVSYLSNDGGHTWRLSETSPQVNASGSLSSVSCDIHNTKCIAIGQYDVLKKKSPPHATLVFTSPDGGNNWHPINIPKTSQNFGFYHQLTCDATGQHCIGVGRSSSSSFLTVYKTDDAGLHWEQPERIEVEALQ